MDLLRQSQLQSEGFRTGSVLERMAFYNIPALSVAVIDDHKLAWAKAWGVAEAGRPEPATTETLFQVASISKPVAALTVLRLVEQGVLSLDEDVNVYLKRWQVPANGGWQPRLTLRHLLSHTGGLIPGGFPGYQVGTTVPSLVEVLSGAPGVNTERAQVVTIPGTAFRYSGAGTCIAQVVMEDVTGRPFEALAEELVLAPLGMTNSTYAQPLPPALAARAAAGHRIGGDPIRGKWHIYPEQAAAGLWSTPTDLAKLVLEIQAIRTGRGGSLLSRATVDEMLTGQFGTHAGLGFFVEGSGEMLRFEHGGDNEGYKAFLLAYAHQGKAAILMTNGDFGPELYVEMLRAIAVEHRWPKDSGYAWFWNDVPAEAWAPGDLSAYAGEYEVRPGLRFTLAVSADGGLLLTATGQPAPVALAPGAPERFKAEAVNLEVTPAEDGQSLQVQSGGARLTAKRVG